MFIFGHIGITYGIIKVLKRHVFFSKLKINYLFIIIGALLPDIIDKPIGEGIFASVFNNGRIYAHTLLFCLLLSVIVINYYKKKRNSTVLLIPIATFMHLLEDQMYMTPQTLFWPIYGWQFPQVYHSNDLLEYLLRVMKSTYTFKASYGFVSEIIGMIIIIYAGMCYLYKRYMHNTMNEYRSK